MKNPTSTLISNSDVKHVHPFTQINPSKRLLTLVTLVHLLAILSFLSAGLAIAWAQIPIVLLCIHMGWYWHRWRCFPVYILRELHQQWCLFPDLPHASKYEGREDEPNNKSLTIVGCHYWSNFLVILIIEDSNACKHYMPILSDCSKSFRRIKVISKTMLDFPVSKLADIHKERDK